MNKEIVYSIITAVYNREDCILRCLNSILSQENKSWEHIVVDDGSTDKTAEIVSDCAKTSHRIRLFQMEKNGGTNAARNLAVKNAKGKYIIILDSDDYFSDNALQVIDESISLHPGYLHYLFVQDDMSSIIQSNKLLKGKDKEILYESWVKSEIEGDFVHVINRKLISKFPFDEKLRIYENLAFMFMYRFSQKQMFINSTVVHRERNRDDSVTKESTLTRITAIQSQYEYLKKIIANFEDDYNKFSHKKLNSMINRCMVFSLALSDYSYYKDQSKRAHKSIPGGSLICALNLGCILKHLIMTYSRIKHL